MSSLNERRAALLLYPMTGSERREMLSILPKGVAKAVRRLMRQLSETGLPVSEVASELLALEHETTLGQAVVDSTTIAMLSKRVHLIWLARVVAAAATTGALVGVDDAADTSLTQMRDAMRGLEALPQRLSEAICAEVRLVDVAESRK